MWYWTTVNVVWYVKQWCCNRSWIFINISIKKLSSSSQFSNSYQQVNSSSSFRSLVIYFATAPISICVVFMRPHRCLLTILESENISWIFYQRDLQYQRQVVVWPKNQIKSSSAFTTFRSKFAAVKHAYKSVNFLCCSVASTYPLRSEVSLCLLVSFFPPCVTLKSLLNTVHKAKPPPFSDFWMNSNLLHHESLNFTQYFLFLDGTGSKLSAIFFCNVFDFFHGIDFTL